MNILLSQKQNCSQNKGRLQAKGLGAQLLAATAQFIKPEGGSTLEGFFNCDWLFKKTHLFSIVALCKLNCVELIV